MKKTLRSGLIAALMLCAASVSAQVIMRGETSAGVYTNVAVDGTGKISTAISGGDASGAASTGNPVRTAFKAYTANPTAVINNRVVDGIATTVGAQIVKQFSIPEGDWTYAAASGGITTTADTQMSAAGAAGIKNYVTGCAMQNASAVVPTEMVIKDGATVIWRGYLGVGTLLNSAVGVVFNTPLKGTAATALNVAAITTASQVYVNCQGYQAP